MVGLLDLGTRGPPLVLLGPGSAFAGYLLLDAIDEDGAVELADEAEDSVLACGDCCCNVVRFGGEVRRVAAGS